MICSRYQDRGVSLVETVIAVLVAFIVVASIGSAVFVAVVANKNQGSETTRLAALAEEKIEELGRLDFGDTSTNTTLISDSGWSVGLKPGGGTAQLSACPTGPPDEGYIDFLDVNGVAAGGSCTTTIGSNNVNSTNRPYAYQRRWRIRNLLSAAVLGTGDGSTKTFSGALTPAPLPAQSLVVTAGSVSGTDDGTGSVTGTSSTSITVTGTIDYSAGTISVTYSAAPDAGTQIQASFKDSTSTAKTAVFGTGDGTTTTFTGVLPGIVPYAPPITSGSVSVTATVAAGTITGADSSGALNGSASITASGTINYNTGTIVVTYSNAPDGGTQVQASSGGQTVTLGTGGSGVKTFSGSLTPVPISFGSVSVTATILAASLTASDNQTGHITGTGIDTAQTNTVNYSTGDITVSFTTAPPGGTQVIASVSQQKVKQITVVVYSRLAINTGAGTPSVTLTTLKSQ